MPEIENGEHEEREQPTESSESNSAPDAGDEHEPADDADERDDEAGSADATEPSSGAGEIVDDDDEEVLFVEVDTEGFEDADTGPDPESELRARIEELESENKNLYQRMLRVAADAENLKRRTEREKEEIRRFGMEKILLDLVPVLDNLDRALTHSAASQDHASLMEGVSMVQRQFVQALQKYGCQSFESMDKPFDPQRHEAVSQVETPEKHPNTVVEEYQKGYFLNDRLIRPAMVVVSRLPPGAEPPATPGAEPPAASGGDEASGTDAEAAGDADAPAHGSGVTGEDGADASSSPDESKSSESGG